MIEPRTLSPFRRFCMTIGELPTSYMESMTYYEMLSWLCNYLETKVVPAVDNNAEALTELQNYVSTYFDNLDIQAEVNTKLDEMAESGQLADIIAEYVQLQGVLAYNTLTELKGAENLSDGSFTKTFGKTTYNDGEGAFYKIRQLTSGDVVDEIHIVSLTNYPTLIAELMSVKAIEDLSDEIDTLTTALTTKLDKTSVKNSQSTTAGEVYDVRYINNYNAVKLWQNEDSSQPFAGQQITLNDDISNYKYYEIIYRRSNANPKYLSTGQLEINNITTLQLGIERNYDRDITAISGNKITFDNCIRYETYGDSNSGATINTSLIPYEVIGYKH